MFVTENGKQSISVVGQNNDRSMKQHYEQQQKYEQQQQMWGHDVTAVWPDSEIKSSQIYSKSYPKSSHNDFT